MRTLFIYITALIAMLSPAISEAIVKLNPVTQKLEITTIYMMELRESETKFRGDTIFNKSTYYISNDGENKRLVIENKEFVVEYMFVVPGVEWLKSKELRPLWDTSFSSHYALPDNQLLTIEFHNMRFTGYEFMDKRNLEYYLENALPHKTIEILDSIGSYIDEVNEFAYYHDKVMSKKMNAFRSTLFLIATRRSTFSISTRNIWRRYMPFSIPIAIASTTKTLIPSTCRNSLSWIMNRFTNSSQTTLSTGLHLIGTHSISGWALSDGREMLFTV